MAVTPFPSFEDYIFRSTLISGATGTGNGAWELVAGMRTLNIHVKGIGAATVTVNGSNDPTKPADSDHEITLASITSDDIVTVQGPLRWMKARVSAHTSGTINAYLEAIN
ncbi:MAG: hypothetical protein ACE5JS_19590 [Nitrospinota bacterium]